MQQQRFDEPVKKKGRALTTSASAHGRLVDAEKLRKAGDLE
jgi:hypothetical protein